MTVMSTRAPHTLGNTRCSRGHIHPPWPTTGTLRIAKCESQCSFCQKETKTAANLRKHVAIHIKNEGLNLTIAEGSSGRGRLEMPSSELERQPSPQQFTHSSIHPANQTSRPILQQAFPAPRPASTQSTPSPIPGFAHLSHSQPYSSNPVNFTTTVPNHGLFPPAHSPINRHYTVPNFSQGPGPALAPAPGPFYASTPPILYQLPQIRDSRSPQHDPFHSLRGHNLTTKVAWTAIPSSEGARTLELCKRNSFFDGNEDSAESSTPASSYYDADSASSSRKGSLVHSPSSSSPPFRTAGSNPAPNASNHDDHLRDDMGMRVPCYNRRVLFDEEWQAHMRDVHGVFLLWPDTWMKRVEVLDLDAFGGDIGACNDVIMDG